MIATTSGSSNTTHDTNYYQIILNSLTSLRSWYRHWWIQQSCTTAGPDVGVQLPLHEVYLTRSTQPGHPSIEVKVKLCHTRYRALGP